MNLFDTTQTFLQTTLIWVKNLGAVGVLVYILVYSLAAVLLIPGTLLTLGGGAIYGVFWGSLYAFSAAIAGSSLAFLVGRYGVRSRVENWIAGNKAFQAIATAVAREGFKIVVLTRLSPIFPFTLLNYAFGVTRVSLKDYVLGSIGMIPGTVMYVYIGSLVNDVTRVGSEQPLSSQAQIGQWVLRGIGLIATIAVTLFITRIARKSLIESIPSGDVTNGTGNQ